MLSRIKETINNSISEVRKVSFPDFPKTRITTIGVLTMIFIVAGIVGLIDFILSRLFKLIF
ncbi:MAG: preprotein translocase subunit SecE [Candidatus Calescibacterium sp.]|nr:preprotein translocase subunit SecE [Candidatus Calescibacterium sp.]MCX7733301.1 preprotein translocase subunit SecE [bacterium]MDW8086777.1 preprotein translocase subunit SecE [Candidatus Calescibacterium sp.]